MEESNKPKKSKMCQILLSCLANTSLLSSGMSLGFTAIALPYMQQPDSSLFIDENQASWVASLASIATPVGCLVSGHLLDVLGRRTSLLLISVPMTIGWLLIGVKPSLPQLYLGRMFTGIGTGLSSIPATVFTAEVVDISLRGMLVVGTSLCISIGVVLVYIMGALLKENWQLVALISAVIPVLTSVLIFFFLPESPVWLVSNNRIEDASKALMYINRVKKSGQVTEELQVLAERARKNQKRSLSLTTTLKALTRPEAYKPLIILNTFFFFQQFTGTFVIIFYAVDVVKGAGVNIDPFLVTVLIGLTRLVFTFLAAYMSRNFGRRPTAVISGVGMTVSLLVLATHILLLQGPPTLILPSLSTNSNITDLFNTSDARAIQETNESISYLPLTMLVLYMLFSTIGFLTLPWSMIGELFPSQVRGIASGLTSCMAYVMSFIILKTYPFLKDVLDKHGIFYFFGIMAFFGTLFVLFFLPETEGKTLQEIEMQFSKKGGRKIVQQEEEVALQKTKRATIVKSTQR